MTTKEKVEEAKKVMNKRSYRFRTDFSKIYPFTTENIDGYMPYFKLKDRSLLTVGSSGDQVINAIFAGCKDITVIDICPFTKEYYELKKAALLSLSREEFMHLLTYTRQRLSFRKKEREKVLDRDLLKKVEETLSEEDSFEFWRELCKEYSPELIRQKLFSRDEYLDERIKRINAYLKTEENYKETQKKIQEVSPTMIEGNIFQQSFDRQFDNIWLSNIFDYHKRNNRKGIENSIDSLKEDGTILLYYLYLISIFGNTVELGDMFDPSTTDIIRLFPYESELIAFAGIDSDIYGRERLKDGVVVYQKKDTK